MTTPPPTDITPHLTATLDHHVVPHGAPLRDHPGAVDAILEDLHAHALRLHRYQPKPSWPVTVEVTTSYVVWQEADTEADAVDTVRRDGAWYERLTGETPVDSWLSSTEGADHHDTHSIYDNNPGPDQVCPQCRHYRWDGISGYLVHLHNCPVTVEKRAQREAEATARQAACEALRCRICQRTPSHPEQPVWHKMDCPNRRKGE